MTDNGSLIALVTGANAGIGFHITQQLARAGVGRLAVAAYQASKSALDMLTVLYAKELAPEEIAILSVSPGCRGNGPQQRGIDAGRR
jgi:NAD(P)-dependent dehydrogenase (short-subunit alcohol dehydrogenase family)